MVAGVEAEGEIGIEQRELELVLAALQAGPVQQPVRIERVVDPAVFRRERDGKPELGRAVADYRAPFLKLLRGRSVFLRDMLDKLLSLGAACAD